MSLVRGDFSAERAESVRSHARSCRHCRELLTRLERDGGRQPGRGDRVYLIPGTCSIDETAVSRSVGLHELAPGSRVEQEPRFDLDPGASGNVRDAGSSILRDATACDAEATDSRTIAVGVADLPVPAGPEDEKSPARPRLEIPGYEILRELGQGGMGVVYEAIDCARNARVALKTVRKKDASAIYRFKQEFRALANLSHPHLIPLFELSMTGDTWFLTMPLIDGVDFLCYVRPDPAALTFELAEPVREVTPPTAFRLVRATTRPESGAPVEPVSPRRETTIPDAPAPSSPLPETVNLDGHSRADASGKNQDVTAAITVDRDLGTTVDVSRANVKTATRHERADPRRGRRQFPLDVARLRQALPQLVRGVLALHNAGKLHRDIKPSNVLVKGDGTVLLLDFGLVAELGTSTFSEERATAGTYESDDSTAGTASYMAPEQAAGDALSPASDWYAVGVMLFESLTGQLPYHGRVFEVLQAKRERDAVAPITLNPDVPPDLNQLCIELLRRNPAERLGGVDILARLGEDVSAECATRDEAAAPAVPLVGRRDELAVLESCFAEVMAGKGATVEVHGRSGAGKTSLVQHFLDAVMARRDVVVLSGRCYEQESIPYKGVDPLIDALTRYLGRLPFHDVRSLLPREIGALARIFPVLGRVDAVASLKDDSAIAPDLQELRTRAFCALRELFSQLAARRPTVLCIDDVQWSDLDSAALLGELLRPPAPPHLMMLLCYRSEYRETSAGLKALKDRLKAEDPATVRCELSVPPLPPETARELARILLPADQAGRAEQVAQESGGNPFFVYELARHVAEGVALPSGSRGLNLDDVLWTRIRRLPPESQRFLETLAVAGQPIKVGIAYAASDLATGQQQVAGVLRSSRLVRGTGPHLDDDIETYHDRIREVVVDRLDPEGLRHHHERLAVTLEYDGTADPETLAVHFHGAGRDAEAGRYYADAADVAASALAFDRAAKLYRRSVELSPPRGEEGRAIRGRLAQALANAGRCVEAADQYLTAAAEADSSERIDLERAAAFHYCAGGEMDQGRKALRTVLGRVGMRLPDSKLHAIVMLLWNRFRVSRRGLGYRLRDESQVPADFLTRIDLAWAIGTGLASKNNIVGPAFQSLNLLWSLQAGEPHRVARALCWEAAQVSIDGISTSRRSAELLEAAESLARQIDQPYIQGMITMARGYRDFCFGRWSTGRSALDEANRIFRERCTGVAWELGQANTCALWCITYEGDWAEMRRRSARLLKVAQEKGDLFTEVNLGTIIVPLTQLGDDRPDEARQTITASIRRWSREEYNIQNMTALMGSTYVDLYLGEPRLSFERHRRQWPALKGAFLFRSQICRLLVAELRARAALGMADTSRNPRPFLHEVEERARRIEREDMPYGNALAKLLQAGVAAIRRNQVLAERRMTEGVRILEGIPMYLTAAVARRRLGELRGGSEGRALIDAADRWLRAHQIQNPERMTAAFMPWTPRS